MKLHYISQVFFEIRPTDQLVSESSSRLASQRPQDPNGASTWPTIHHYLHPTHQFRLPDNILKCVVKLFSINIHTNNN